MKQQEINEVGDNASPRPSRLPSPERASHPDERSDFPFTTRGGTRSMVFLLSGLPDVYEARVLVDSYFRYFAWQYVENCHDDYLHQF